MERDDRSNTNQSKPDWWEKNEAYRAEFDLPEYDPPKFQDDTYTHVVMDELEEEYGVTIRLLCVNTDYPDDMKVRVDGKTLFTVGRHRTANGNSVYELTADEFRARFDAEFQKWTE